MIELLIPVLGRPKNAQPLVESIHANTEEEHRIVFLVTPGDTDQIEACKGTGSVVWIVHGDDHQYPRKINAGARLRIGNTPPDFIFLGADDLGFHRGWDTAAIDLYHETGKPVIGTNDLGNPTVMAGKHATHSLVHRSYLELGTIDEPHNLLHEGYNHNFCDTEFIETAMMRDAFAFAFDSHVEHLHYIWRKGRSDVIYEKGQKHFHRDAALFKARRRRWRERA